MSETQLLTTTPTDAVQLEIEKENAALQRLDARKKKITDLRKKRLERRAKAHRKATATLVKIYGEAVLKDNDAALWELLKQKLDKNDLAKVAAAKIRLRS